jgi:hypothetical protein
MNVFWIALALAVGLVLVIVLVLAFIGFTITRIVIAAKEVVDYYLEQKKKLVTEMEAEMGQAFSRTNFKQ